MRTSTAALPSAPALAADAKYRSAAVRCTANHKRSRVGDATERAARGAPAIWADADADDAAEAGARGAARAVPLRCSAV